MPSIVGRSDRDEEYYKCVNQINGLWGQFHQIMNSAKRATESGHLETASRLIKQAEDLKAQINNLLKKCPPRDAPRIPGLMERIQYPTKNLVDTNMDQGSTPTALDYMLDGSGGYYQKINGHWIHFKNFDNFKSDQPPLKDLKSRNSSNSSIFPLLKTADQLVIPSGAPGAGYAMPTWWWNGLYKFIRERTKQQGNYYIPKSKTGNYLPKGASEGPTIINPLTWFRGLISLLKPKKYLPKGATSGPSVDPRDWLKGKTSLLSQPTPIPPMPSPRPDGVWNWSPNEYQWFFTFNQVPGYLQQSNRMIPSMLRQPAVPQASTQAIQPTTTIQSVVSSPALKSSNLPNVVDQMVPLANRTQGTVIQPTSLATPVVPTTQVVTTMQQPSAAQMQLWQQRQQQIASNYAKKS